MLIQITEADIRLSNRFSDVCHGKGHRNWQCRVAILDFPTYMLQNFLQEFILEA